MEAFRKTEQVIQGISRWKIVVSRCQGQREERDGGQKSSSLLGRRLAGQRKDKTMRQNDRVDNFGLWPRGKRALDEVSCC